MAELPGELIQQVQKYTGRPWWNGEAYVCAVGWHALALHAGNVVDDLEDVIEWLRDEKQYDKSDRLRVIRKRLNDALIYPAFTHHRKT